MGSVLSPLVVGVVVVAVVAVVVMAATRRADRRWQDAEDRVVRRSPVSDRDRGVVYRPGGEHRRVWVIGTVRGGGREVRMSWEDVRELAKEESRGVGGREVYVTSREGGVVQTWVFRHGGQKRKLGDDGNGWRGAF
ncbi:hypothetical protein DQ384_37565 [Sphaerisporangium album]|uniref:DUF2550 family protein n=1 Tax=Sphaerisporangium album TaxID=509200 RepID=A0A367EPW8_9ACTN|nr:hypothetical protein DQ384_37565 [Sphaerisporangium album]